MYVPTNNERRQTGVFAWFRDKMLGFLRMECGDSGTWTCAAQGLKARGNVEDWLGKVEESMFFSLRKLVRAAMTDFEQKSREEWVLQHASQVDIWGEILAGKKVIKFREILDIFETRF